MTFLYNEEKLKIKRKNLRNNMPQPEQVLWYYLRARNLKGYKFRRQFSIGNYIVDFFCPQLKLAIEIDGDSHFMDEKVIIYDKNRDLYLKSQGVQIIRFTNIEVTKNIEAVVEKILKYLPANNYLPDAGSGKS